MTHVTLSPDQERFVTELLKNDRYRDIAEVVAAALEGLKRFEEQRVALLSSVLAAQEEGDRDGYLTGDDVLARVETRLAKRPASAT
jgi:putative addiction module CopG family antidote